MLHPIKPAKPGAPKALVPPGAPEAPVVPGAPEALAIYVHWPFCLSKCPYCDFNSHVQGEVDHHRWREALLRELDYFASETIGKTVTSIFFGGGTPSLMEPATVAAIIDATRARWTLSSDVEITLEANPTSVEAARFEAFAAAGVNRLSLGIQALDDDALLFLGRHHCADEALDALACAKDTFDRYSFDLIYARPGQTLDAWAGELEAALALAGDHLSLYQLTIERGTAFYRDAIPQMDEDDGAALFELTRVITETAGLAAYEISNHARPGGECRHNLTYWRGGDYIGVGPGAHGRITNNGTTEATATLAAPDRWLAAALAGGHATQRRELLTPEARRDELVLMGLRLREGIDRRWFEQRLNRPMEAAFDQGALNTLIDDGLVVLDHHGLKATNEGLMRLDSVTRALLTISMP